MSIPFAPSMFLTIAANKWTAKQQSRKEYESAKGI